MSNDRNAEKRSEQRRQGERRVITIAVYPDRRASDRRGGERRTPQPQA